MTANDYLIDATTRNAVFTQRLAFGEYKKLVRYLEELQVSINGTLSTGDFTKARQEQVLLQVAQLNRDYFDELSNQIRESAQNTAQYSAGFTKRLMDKASKVEFAILSETEISQKAMTAVMSVKPGVKSITMNDAIIQYGNNKSAEILRVITDGIIAGSTKDQIIKNLDGRIALDKRQLETLVRTITNSSANIGRMATLAENQEYLEGYEWVAKLDSRTTLVCAGRDGKVYQFASNNPIPPAHWGCRSQIVAALLPQYEKPGLKGEKNAEGGKVTANTTYGAWLKNQPPDFISEALGPERASLFINGGLKIERFTDTTGKAYTLDQLRQLEPMAFEKAGL